MSRIIDSSPITHQRRPHVPGIRMTFRTVAREVRDFPATACFSLIWILVFVASP